MSALISPGESQQKASTGCSKKTEEVTWREWERCGMNRKGDRDEKEKKDFSRRRDGRKRETARGTAAVDVET